MVSEKGSEIMTRCSLKLFHNKIDIWDADIDSIDFNTEEFKKILSSDELERADRLVSKELKNHFIVSRGILRKLLSRYSGIKPEAILFQYNNYGKPELIQKNEEDKIFFNLSHSGTRTFYAFTLNIAVGIDIEQIKEKIDYENIAKRYFSDQEFKTIMNLPVIQRKETFYRFWTQKEAYAKAIGSSIFHLFDKKADTSQWFIFNFNFDSYIAAVTVNKKNSKVRYLTYF